jgi:hypothetical protein
MTKATAIKRLGLLALVGLSMTVGSGLAASPAAAQGGGMPGVRRFTGSQEVTAPNPAVQPYRDVQGNGLREANAPAPGGQAGGVGPAVNDPVAQRFEIIHLTLFYRTNFMGIAGQEGTLGALGCERATETRKRELGAVAAHYEYSTKDAVLYTTEQCVGFFTVRR